MLRTMMAFLFGLVTGIALIYMLDGPLDFKLLREDASKALDAVGRTARDLKLETAVRTALALHKDFDLFGGVHVDVEVDHVTLSGTVGSNDQRKLAEIIARGVDDVESVENQLVVHRPRDELP